MPLIVLEGPEGAGKTTQIPLLAKRLERKAKVLTLREPGGTPLGDEIRRVLLDPKSVISPRAEALLYIASRAQLIESAIAPALATGTIVILDRFFLATYAYQAAGRGLPEELVVATNQIAAAGVIPDVTVLLTLPAEEGLARATKRGPQDRMEQADAAFHRRVAEAYATFATAKWQKAHPEAGPIESVDARGTVEQVAERIHAAVGKRLGTGNWE